MSAGKPIQACPADAQRIWTGLRLLPGGSPIYIAWGAPNALMCAYPMGGWAAPLCCCADSPFEREYWYQRYGAMQQWELYAWLQQSGGSAQLQVSELRYYETLTTKCAAEAEAEKWSLPAGANPHYVPTCRVVTIR